ncbi:hypothetical protein MNBD_CHLOROFLEXI01-4900 [hydrothermal vent metagenome]|uniref:Uncharacterized protein n=1 Tax=hydrothermal vent metagenome TaxID=652676 RepID=A0A3B0VGB4_9ZZZZ
MPPSTMNEFIDYCKKPDSKIFCGFILIHRINPVSEIKNLLQQVETAVFSAL